MVWRKDKTTQSVKQLTNSQMPLMGYFQLQRGAQLILEENQGFKKDYNLPAKIFKSEMRKK